MIYWILLLPTRKLTVVLRSYGNLLSVLFTINLTSILFIKFSQPYSLYPLSYFLYPILFILCTYHILLTLFFTPLPSLFFTPLPSLFSTFYLLSLIYLYVLLSISFKPFTILYPPRTRCIRVLSRFPHTSIPCYFINNIASATPKPPTRIHQ